MSPGWRRKEKRIQLGERRQGSNEEGTYDDVIGRDVGRHSYITSQRVFAVERAGRGGVRGGEGDERVDGGGGGRGRAVEGSLEGDGGKSGRKIGGSFYSD